MKKKFEIVHQSFAIEKEVIDKIKKIIENGKYSYNDRPTISSFIRDAVYEKLEDVEKK